MEIINSKLDSILTTAAKEELMRKKNKNDIEYYAFDQIKPQDIKEEDVHSVKTINRINEARTEIQKQHINTFTAKEYESWRMILETEDKLKLCLRENVSKSLDCRHLVYKYETLVNSLQGSNSYGSKRGSIEENFEAITDPENTL